MNDPNSIEALQRDLDYWRGEAERLRSSAEHAQRVVDELTRRLAAKRALEEDEER